MWPFLILQWSVNNLLQELILTSYCLRHMFLDPECEQSFSITMQHPSPATLSNNVDKWVESVSFCHLFLPVGLWHTHRFWSQHLPILQSSQAVITGEWMSDDRHSGTRLLVVLKPSQSVVEMTIRVGFKNRLTSTGCMLSHHPCHTWLFMRRSSHQLASKNFLESIKIHYVESFSELATHMERYCDPLLILYVKFSLKLFENLLKIA